MITTADAGTDPELPSDVHDGKINTEKNRDVTTTKSSAANNNTTTEHSSKNKKSSANDSSEKNSHSKTESSTQEENFASTESHTNEQTTASASATESDTSEASTKHTHDFVLTNTQDATCTQDGCRVYTCTCGESYTESIPAIGHNYVSTFDDEYLISSDPCEGTTCICYDWYESAGIDEEGNPYTSHSNHHFPRNPGESEQDFWNRFYAFCDEQTASGHGEVNHWFPCNIHGLYYIEIRTRCEIKTCSNCGDERVYDLGGPRIETYVPDF